MIQGGKRFVYDYLQAYSPYLAPPIVGNPASASSWRLNGPGSPGRLLWGLEWGCSVSMIRLVKLMGTTDTEGSFLWVVSNIFFQYYSADHRGLYHRLYPG